MTRDLLQLSWLRWRHARGRATYWAALAGADIESKTLGERSYVLYLALIVCAWLVAMLAAAADAAYGLGQSTGGSAADAIRALLLVTPSLLIGVLGARALRSSPVKLTFPDIAYVGGSTLDLRAVALTSLSREVGPAALAAVVIGYLGGCVATGAGAPDTAPWSLAVCLPLVALVALALVWAVGIARLRMGRAAWPSLAWVSAPAFALAGMLVPTALRWPATSLVSAAQGSPDPVGTAVLLIAVGVSVWLVARSGSRMDMTAVIGESALYAQLQVFRPLQLYDPTAYADIVRRKRLARRRPRWHMPSVQGGAALVARAILSHIRQPGSLVWPIIWGAGILPFVAAAATEPRGLFASLPAVFVFVAGPSARLVHVFEQDADRPSLRGALPFDNLAVLLLDSLPVLVLMLSSSAIVVSLLAASAEARFVGTLMCVLLGVLIVLCAGFERVTLPRMRAPIGHGITATLGVSGVLYAGAVGSSLIACGAALAAVIAMGFLVARSTD